MKYTLLHWIIAKLNIKYFALCQYNEYSLSTITYQKGESTMKAITLRDRKRNNHESTKFFIKPKRNPLPQNSVITDSSLLTEMYQAKKDIDTILLHLNYQTDPDLIDCYTYQLKGAYMRYKFLLRQAQGEAS